MQFWTKNLFDVANSPHRYHPRIGKLIVNSPRWAVNSYIVMPEDSNLAMALKSLVENHD